MQIATSLLFDRTAARMSSLSANAARLQAQIATGKKLTSPSQDVAVAQQIAEFDRKDADSAAYATNLTLASSLLKQADSTLGSMTEQLNSALEIATQAATGTLSAANRKTLGNSLSSIVDSLMGLGNTKDLRGQPLFGSASGTAAVTKNADGTFSYNAAVKLSEVPIADGVTVQPTETAARIFNSGAGDTLAMLTTLAEALKTGAETSTADARNALDSISTANEQVATVQASIGARGARVDMQQTLLTNADTDRAELRSSLEDVDPYIAYTELQKTMTILTATQQSFSKLASLSIFDYIR